MKSTTNWFLLLIAAHYKVYSGHQSGAGWRETKSSKGRAPQEATAAELAERVSSFVLPRITKTAVIVLRGRMLRRAVLTWSPLIPPA